MARPAAIPERGDVPVSSVARLLGLSDVREFAALQPRLEARGFPRPDPDTGRYCVEAVDRWRRLRSARLFPELASANIAADPRVDFQERMQRVGRG